ncbi:pyridoxamine 5'-phosphate oxidase family protein [Anaerosacchariphilus polymeriproducens]|uniref:Pyridoxamine 5-phosphate oxidase n=1 Tax=Anaerosacchariphilus polymeriproducens TaxID=1812858 RepID=A0A371ASI4_9FIRM|nr:pyridoxamine 5'-phosphate oxidase family protein [Anaerosacchariphilus polymeriproducens]RDU22502.1 pyridoxamine 5-phosphate oxidase [Anaerosacchariphilus polymeriproducens]
MIDYVSILEKNPNGVLATQDDDKLRTRVFQYLFADGKKIYFCTSSEKAVFAQINSNPNVSFCTYPQNYTPVLSISGKAAFVEDKELKERALDENPSIKSMYGSTENPLFKIFYINIEEIKTFSIAEGLKQFKL